MPFGIGLSFNHEQFPATLMRLSSPNCFLISRAYALPIHLSFSENWLGRGSIPHNLVCRSLILGKIVQFFRFLRSPLNESRKPYVNSLLACGTIYAIAWIYSPTLPLLLLFRPFALIYYYYYSLLPNLYLHQSKLETRNSFISIRLPPHVRLLRWERAS